MRAIVAHGLTPFLTVTGAPSFAEGPHRPRSADPGSWKPDPKAFGQFARALASRYSGSFGGLPRVRYLQAWNEPNLSRYLSPQYVGQREAAAGRYLKLLNAFYRGVKSVKRGDVVVTAGTAPYGDPPGGSRTRPLTFLKNLLCLRKGVRKRECGKPKFDVLAHHPINTDGPPTRSAADPNDATTADFKEVRRLLRRAERRHTMGTAGRHPLWATEIWWESNPPDKRHGLPLARQARYLEQALHILWKQGARVVINLEVRDPPTSDTSQTVEAGLLFQNGRKKPAFQAFRFPFVTERSGNGTRAWGKAPSTGRLAIQVARHKHWRTVHHLHVVAGRVFSASLSAGGRHRFRAVIGKDRSLVWAQR